MVGVLVATAGLALMTLEGESGPSTGAMSFRFFVPLALPRTS